MICGTAAATELREVASYNTDQLIAALADPDSAVRDEAAQRLIDMGPRARPQVLQASRGDDPEQRAQAARILRQLPWHSDADPADVREVLEHYGEGNDIGRIQAIQRLYQLRATPTLLRLLDEEPSDLIRWIIVDVLSYLRDADSLKAIGKLKPADDDAPTLFLLGRTLIETDRAQSLRLLRRAIDAEASHPSSDGGLLDFAYDQLVAAAMENRDFEEAAALLRRQVPRDLVARRSPRRWRPMPSASLPRLVALHEYFGPLRRFAWDCQTWNINASERPGLLCGITTRLSWLGFAPPLPMRLTADWAIADRYRAGSFLATAELTAPAEYELDTAARMLDVSNEQRVRIIRASESGRDDVSDMLSELYWRRARAAFDAGDNEAVDREIQRLLNFTPSNADASIRIVVWLKESKRKKEADAIFQRLYDAGRANIDRSVNKAGGRNDLAWLCARCGERVDEAVQLAQQAVDEMPDFAPFLDTLAEAKYRSGAVEGAIKLETRAVQLSPDSKFMKEQLERFRARKP